MTPFLFCLIALYCLLSIIALAGCAIDTYRERKWRTWR